MWNRLGAAARKQQQEAAEQGKKENLLTERQNLGPSVELQGSWGEDERKKRQSPARAAQKQPNDEKNPGIQNKLQHQDGC